MVQLTALGSVLWAVMSISVTRFNEDKRTVVRLQSRIPFSCVDKDQLQEKPPSLNCIKMLCSVFSESPPSVIFGDFQVKLHT